MSTSSDGASTNSAIDGKIQEFWTVSMRCVVISATRPRLQTLADQIGVARGEIIDISANRAVLPLWGEELDRYQADVKLRQRTSAAHF